MYVNKLIRQSEYLKSLIPMFLQQGKNNQSDTNKFNDLHQGLIKNKEILENDLISALHKSQIKTDQYLLNHVSTIETKSVSQPTSPLEINELNPQ